MWRAGAACCCAMGPWVIFSECWLLTSEEESAADEEEVFECSRRMAKEGNLFVSTRMRTSASCSLGTMHLFTSVSAPLDVRPPPSCQTLSPKQLCNFSCGKNPVTNTCTHTLKPFHSTQDMWSYFTNTCTYRSFYFKDQHTGAPWKQTKDMLQSQQTKTQKNETYNQSHHLRRDSIVNAWKKIHREKFKGRKETAFKVYF